MKNTSNPEPWEEFYRYWLSKHVGARPPARSEIDPMIDLPHLASNLIVIGVRDGHAEYHLVGSNVVTHFGVDHTGKTVGTSGIDAIQLSAWRDAVEAAVLAGKPQILVSYYKGAEKSQTIAMLLPLTPGADGAKKLLGATFFGYPFPSDGALGGLPIKKVALDL